MLTPSPVFEPSYTSFPRVAASSENCRRFKNTLGASADVTDKFVTANEDKEDGIAAAAIAKSLVRQVVEAEEKELIASLVNKAAQ